MPQIEWNLFSIVETGLTVPVLASIIGGVTTLLTHGTPLFVISFMIFFVRRGRHDNATWTTIGSLLQGSLWPALLQQTPGNFEVRKWRPWKKPYREQTFVKKHVEWKFWFFSCTLLVSTIIFIIAGFVTPLGLRVVLAPAKHVSNFAFELADDASFNGIGSQLPATSSFQRGCGWNVAMPCPGQPPYFPGMFNSTLPSNITSTFTPKTLSKTVARPFDITFRHWYLRNFTNLDIGEVKAVGSFLPMNSLLLEDSYVLVQGLIVDAHRGGIGIRNHTIPSKAQLGAQWTEDILWITPVTSCTDTNLTINYAISLGNVQDKVNGYLEDQGGFCNLAPDEPSPSWSMNSTGWQQTGAEPQLDQLSYHTAWWNNQLTAKVLGINSSTLGEQYSQQSNQTTDLLPSNAIEVSAINGDYMDSIFDAVSPYVSDFAELNMRCTGYNESAKSIGPDASIHCGYLQGVSQPKGDSTRQDLGSQWYRNLYTCASAVKASIQTVTFRYNGTSALTALEVVDVRPKDYGIALPAFAVEKRSAAYAFWDIDLLWGAVDPDVKESDDLFVFNTPEIYLPAGTQDRNMGIRQVDMNAAGRAFQDVWHSVYLSAAGVHGVSLQGIPNYGGGDDNELTAKWRNLSTTPVGAAQILNLLWTNLAASLVSGSNTGFEDYSDGSPFAKATTVGDRAVNRIIAKPAYENWAYAIPAFLGAGIFLFLGLLPTLILMIFRALTIGQIKYYIQQTSAARAISQFATRDLRTNDPKRVPPSMSGETWVKRFGSRLWIVEPYDEAMQENEDDNTSVGASTRATPRVSNAGNAEERVPLQAI